MELILLPKYFPKKEEDKEKSNKKLSINPPPSPLQN